MKYSGGNVILRGIFHVVSGCPLHFMLYRGNLDCFSSRVEQYVNVLTNLVNHLSEHTWLLSEHTWLLSEHTNVTHAHLC